MKKIEDLIKKVKIKKSDKPRRVKNEFQEIALELCAEFNVRDNKTKKMMFGFIKKQLKRGNWGKIKEVREQMQSREIYNVNYFMACFRKNEPRQTGTNSSGDFRAMEQSQKKR